MASIITIFTCNRKYLAVPEKWATKDRGKYPDQKWSVWNPERLAEDQIGLYKKPLPVHTRPPRQYNNLRLGSVFEIFVG